MKETNKGDDVQYGISLMHASDCVAFEGRDY
jgi:hypothetical protein